MKFCAFDDILKKKSYFDTMKCKNTTQISTKFHMIIKFSISYYKIFMTRDSNTQIKFIDIDDPALIYIDDLNTIFTYYRRYYHSDLFLINANFFKYFFANEYLIYI